MAAVGGVFGREEQEFPGLAGQPLRIAAVDLHREGVAPCPQLLVGGDDRLTEDGLWASQLRVDQPLLVAEALSLGLFPDADPPPEVLAAGKRAMAQGPHQYAVTWGAPRFREALDSALVAEMEPGDALFLPSMWWHHVEGLEAFNILINYWWRQSPAFMGSPANVLDHAFLSLRDLPPAQRKAWQEIFRHYIFEFDETELAHIPEHARGILNPVDDLSARKLRAQLLNKLNR